LVVGGGVQGACAYRRLEAEGRRVLLVEQRDFAAATSQASAMLVWGGLLYLRNGEWAEVRRLCAARDELAGRYSEWVEPHRLRYVFGRPRRYPAAIVAAALTVYWLLGGCRRAAPRWERAFAERAMLSAAGGSVTFEEARLCRSDAQFVLGWLTQAAGRADSQAVNYAELVAARWDRGTWRVGLRDGLDGSETELRSRCVVNAAGVWVDAVHARCGVSAPWTHVLGKGVSLCVPRHPSHRDTLLFDDIGWAQGCSMVPWGPVALWGSTETRASCADTAFRPTAHDVRALLQALGRHLAAPPGPRDVVSLRCGVRPLVVRRGERSAGVGDPLALSRRHVVWQDRERPWVTVFGGKLTGALLVADRVGQAVRRFLSHPAAPARHVPTPPPRAVDRLCGLAEPVAAVEWCREHTQCWTLEDYLRRRTNIAQWVPRGGRGRNGEHDADLLRVAMALTGDASTAQRALHDYRCRVAADHDTILAEAAKGDEL